MRRREDDDPVISMIRLVPAGSVVREILGEAGGRDGRPIRELRRPRRVCARAAAILMIPVPGCGGITVEEYMAREPCVPGRTCGEAWRTHRPFPIDRATPVPSDWSPGVERAPHTCAARQGRTPYCVLPVFGWLLGWCPAGCSGLVLHSRRRRQQQPSSRSRQQPPSSRTG